METFFNFLKEYWQFTIIGIGVLFLIGAIFNINFIIDRQGEPVGILQWFGDKGYRIIMGICGSCLIAYGVVYLFI